MINFLAPAAADYFWLGWCSGALIAGGTMFALGRWSAFAASAREEDE